jgi:hypothetical protein
MVQIRPEKDRSEMRQYVDNAVVDTQNPLEATRLLYNYKYTHKD